MPKIIWRHLLKYPRSSLPYREDPALKDSPFLRSMSNFCYRSVIHPAVPIKIVLCLFRSKTVCSYNVLLSCSQSADCRQTLLLNPFPLKFYWSPRCSRENRLLGCYLYKIKWASWYTTLFLASCSLRLMHSDHMSGYGVIVCNC